MKRTGIQLNNSLNALEAMDLKIDVLRNGEGKIIHGLSVGDTMNQNQALIIMSNPGEFPFVPTIGCAIQDLILDNDYLRMRHRIRDHFSKDGLKIQKLEFSEGKPLVIDAIYE